MCIYTLLLLYFYVDNCLTLVVQNVLNIEDGVWVYWKDLINFQLKVPTLLLWNYPLYPSPSKTPIKGTRCSSCLSLHNWFPFPASPRKYSNRTSTTYSRSQVSSHFLEITKPSSHMWLSTLFLSTTPMRPCSVWFLLPQAVSVCNKNCCQTYFSSVGCHVFSHAHTPRVGVPPSLMGWIGGN